MIIPPNGECMSEPTLGSFVMLLQLLEEQVIGGTLGDVNMNNPTV
jgi:hypothetical protein